MAKYFSGITLNNNKYTISIIDDNLNIIFMDTLDFDRIVDLFKRKSVTTISLDIPLASCLKGSYHIINTNEFKIKRRSFDSIIDSRNLFTYGVNLILDKNSLEETEKLYRQLNMLGFSIKNPGETEKAIIESYTDTSFSVIGCLDNKSLSFEENSKAKLELLKNKGIRMKNYIKIDGKSFSSEINTLCQAYTSYLYYMGEATFLGSPEEGILVLPTKHALRSTRFSKGVHKSSKPESTTRSNFSEPQGNQSYSKTVNSIPKFKSSSIIAEYCGAQYLYTNTDGIIRINDLRPIKSYRPFTEIYEMKHIKQVQVIINTTDGLRKVKANLIPNAENSNSFRAAEEEDKKKLDNFWGDRGDKRGYLIKFNKVEVIKANA